VLGELGPKVVDLLEHVGHVDDVAHGEAGVDLLHLRAAEQAEHRADSGRVAAAADDVEAAARHGLGEDFGGKNLFLAPDHAVLERCVDIEVAVQAVVDNLDVVDQADEDVRAQGGDLIEIEGAEQAVTPAEGGVGVDQHVLVPVGLGDGVLEGGAAEGVEAADGQVEDAARADVLGLGIHHVADVVDLHPGLALLAGHLGDGLEVGLLVHADLAGDDGAHAGLLAVGAAA